MDEHGRPPPPLDADEVATLRGFLDRQRATFAWRCSGLDDAQLRAPLHPTTMTLAGMLLHLVRVEEYWFGEVVAAAGKAEPWASTPWAAEWAGAARHSGEELRRAWREQVARSQARTAAALERGGLETTHEAWDGQGHPSLRWVLLHLVRVEEYWFGEVVGNQQGSSAIVLPDLPSARRSHRP